MTKPALILIDLQRAMLPQNTGPRNNPGAEDNIARLLAAWRERGLPVVHVRHFSRSPDGAFQRGEPSSEFQPRFEPLPSEHRLEKTVPDAFAGGELAPWLKARDLSSLVIVGVSTSNSVEATVRAAACQGFDVTVPGDACFTFDKADLHGRMRPAEEWSLFSLSNLHGEYAVVTTTAEVLASAS